MKIYFDNVNFEAENTGPNCFAKRLAIQLGYFGHQIADPHDYDVSIVFIEPTNKLNVSKPFLHRVDGMWMKPEQHNSGMNKNIEWAHKNANVVVYQSEFDKIMLNKWLGHSKKSVVIANGIELQETKLRSESLIEIKKKFDKVFCCSANWHPQKRLKDNIELFKKIRSQQYPNSCLIVMGDNPDHVISDRSIFYTGSIRHDLCAEIYSISDWMIHLAYLDHMPNVCVEAVSQGCPIICTTSGGTKELVLQNNGIVLTEDEYDFSLVDYDNPPRVTFNDLQNLPENYRSNPATVDIVKIAKSYEKALELALV